MPHWGPIHRRDLIHYLREAGFEGPYSGGRHQYMIRDNKTIRIPNPHKQDIGQSLLT